MDRVYFQHHPDGFISINDGTLSIMMDLSVFGLFEPDYVLEPPYISQFYEPGISWAKNTARDGTNFPLPYAAGDTYISKVAYYIANIPAIPPTLEEEKAIKIAELNILALAVFFGGINYAAMSEIFKSVEHSANALIDYKDAGTVPVGFMLKNFSDVDTSITLAQLLTLNSGIVELHYSTEPNRFSHEVAINALTTVLDVENYDITTGWETVPYVI